MLWETADFHCDVQLRAMHRERKCVFLWRCTLFMYTVCNVRCASIYSSELSISCMYLIYQEDC